MNLIQAVQHQYLVQWHDHGYVRTVEPHLFGCSPGTRLVLIAYQIAGGPVDEAVEGWKVIDVHDGLNVAQDTFIATRPIPGHLQQLVHHVFASVPGLLVANVDVRK